MMFEGAHIPFAAKWRWPGINADTAIVLCNHYMVAMPVMNNELLTLFTEPQPPPLPYEVEHIMLHRLYNHPTIEAVGYGKRSNTLAMQMKQ